MSFVSSRRIPYRSHRGLQLPGGVFGSQPKQDSLGVLPVQLDILTQRRVSHAISTSAYDYLRKMLFTLLTTGTYWYIHSNYE